MPSLWFPVTSDPSTLPVGVPQHELCRAGGNGPEHEERDL